MRLLGLLLICFIIGSCANRSKTSNISSITPNVILPEKDTTTAIGDTVNIDFMLRGYFYAASLPTFDDEDDFGGWGGSGNLPKLISDRSIASPGLLQVIARINEKALFGEKYQGFKVYLANSTGGNVRFGAQDSRLNIKMQAVTKKGRWADIEYLPGSWCGNSYHNIELPTQHYWEFTVPYHRGKRKTKGRIVVTYVNPADPKEPLVLYSNEFYTSVNEGQFSKQLEYEPQGIMDPYLN